MCVILYICGLKRAGVKKSARHHCSSAVSGEAVRHKQHSTISRKWPNKWNIYVIVWTVWVCVCVCSCILLVWLITEGVTHNTKCAYICICSLDRKDRGGSLLLKSCLVPCKVLSYVQLLLSIHLVSEREIASFISHLLWHLFHMYSNSLLFQDSFSNVYLNV